MIYNGVVQELPDSEDLQRQFLREACCESLAEFADRECGCAPRFGKLDREFIEYESNLQRLLNFNY